MVANLTFSMESSGTHTFKTPLIRLLSLFYVAFWLKAIMIFDSRWAQLIPDELTWSAVMTDEPRRAQMIPYDPRWSQMIADDPRLSQMSRDDPKWSQMVSDEMSPDDRRWSQTKWYQMIPDPDDPSWSTGLTQGSNAIWGPKRLSHLPGFLRF